MKALTGKAFKSFKAYIKKENGWTSEDFTNHYKCQGYDKYTLADIIEWLDSVGIYVDCPPHNNYGEFFSKLYTSNKSGQPICLMDMDANPIVYYSRQQATVKAIERAVELFNGK